MIQIPYDPLNTFYGLYIAAVVGIISLHKREHLIPLFKDCNPQTQTTKLLEYTQTTECCSIDWHTTHMSRLQVSTMLSLSSTLMQLCNN